MEYQLTPWWVRVGAAANLVRRVRAAGATGRFAELDAKAKHEVDTEQMMGGIKDWHSEDAGIVLQVELPEI
eukprot:3546035-Rhodomonas_salina.2